MDINTIYNYITFLIKGLQLILKPGYSVKYNAYPFDKGCVLNITFRPGQGSTINIHDTDNLKNIFEKLHIENVFHINNYDDVVFGGTNIVKANGSIYFIKDLDEKNWTPSAAGDDIKRLIEKN